MAEMLGILLKKSLCQSLAKFPSNLLFLLRILIQGYPLPNSILSAQRKKIRLADFFNRILGGADRRVSGG